MSVELSNINGPGPDAANVAVINNETLAADDDSALSAIWNKNERDNGAERENGRFASPDPEKRMDPLEGGEGEGQPDASSTPDVAAVPLPANWRGKEELWNRVPAELKAGLAELDTGLHRTLSDQGRQLSAYKPLADIIEKNKNYFDGSIKGPDGNAITPAAGIDYLFNVQRSMDQNPVETLLQIADRYGARDKLATALGQKPAEGQQGNELRSVIAGLEQRLAALTNPAAIDDRISRKFEEKAAAEAAAEEVGRLAKDKPLFSEIPEKRMVSFINDAWERLGDTASKDAVFDLAYDMAVNADPTLRTKAAAASKAAAGHDPKKVEGAKRAAGVNVTSTQSGKGRELTEDEELAVAYQRSQKG